MNALTPFVLFSAERAEYSADINASRTEFLRRQLAQRDLSFSPVLGSYKNVPENSLGPRA